MTRPATDPIRKSENLTTLHNLSACAEAVQFTAANPGLSWPELARKSKRIDWVLWLLARHGEPGFSLGATDLERQQSITRFACWCATRCLPIFEKRYPKDKRPRQAIETAQKWAENPTKENRAAAAAVYAAATDATYAAATATYAAATDAYAAATDATDAAAAAAYATDAAAAAAATDAATARIEARSAQMDELLRMATSNVEAAQ
jgi:hypothetical protein